MADTLTALVKLLLKSRQVKDQALKDPVSVVDLPWEQNFTSGSGAGQVKPPSPV